jgi:hypothetical protein
MPERGQELDSVWALESLKLMGDHSPALANKARRSVFAPGGSTRQALPSTMHFGVKRNQAIAKIEKGNWHFYWR